MLENWRNTPHWSLAALLFSILYLIWGLSRSRTKSAQTSIESPNAAIDADHDDHDEVEVPFDIGEVRVSKILVHPIKSCRGTSMSEVCYRPDGIENDRKWCIIDAKTHVVLTARQVPKMVLITPRVHPDTSSPYGGLLAVSFPEDSGCDNFAVPLLPTDEMLREWDMIDDSMMHSVFKVDGYICQTLSTTSPSDTPSTTLSKYIGKPVHLIMKGPVERKCPPTHAFPQLESPSALQDAYPLLVASEESLAEFQKDVREFVKNEGEPIGGLDYTRWAKGEVNIERFRPNFVFKGAGVPFAEDFWREITIGSNTSPITHVSKCTRCLLPNVDTETGVRDAAVPFKILVKTRRGKDQVDTNKPCFGCNGVFGGHGTVKVGDVVKVNQWTAADGV